MAHRSGVFISYSRQDSEEFAKELRKRIEDNGISVWHDRVDMEGGRDWWLQIIDALDQVEYMVLIATPAAMVSPVVRKEWRYARQQGVCVYPVQVPNVKVDFDALPHWMRNTHFYDFANEDQIQSFFRALQSRCSVPRVPFMVTELPENFVYRHEEISHIINEILNNNKNANVAITAALKGAGGYGKTTIAGAICYDDEIQEYFDDGILWVTLGENPGDLTRRVLDLIETLSGTRPAFVGIEAATAHLKTLLHDRDILLVVDDVWNQAHLRPFIQGGDRCVRLITTRNDTVLPFRTRKIIVDAMRPQESGILLSSGLNLDEADHQALRMIAERLGHWALLLKLANSVLRERVNRGATVAQALAYITTALDKRGLAAFDAHDIDDREYAVAHTLSISFELLEADHYQRFAELCIFPEDVNIPLVTVNKLWNATAQYDEFDTEDLCERLANLSLLFDFSLESQTLRLHDTIRKYLRDNYPDIRQLNIDFLANYGLENWEQVPPEEPYLWDYLVYHLVESGQREVLIDTLQDLNFLARRLYLRDVYRVENDFVIASPVTGGEASIQELQLNVASIGHVLNRCENVDEVAETLYIRLQGISNLAESLKALETRLQYPILTPANILPDRPHPALIRTLTGHTDMVLACDISPDGLFIASASNDTTVRLWSAVNGQQLLEIAAHQGGVTDCQFSPDGFMIASCSVVDNTASIWEIATRTEKLRVQHHRVWRCAFTSDQRYLLTLSTLGDLKIWDTANGELIKSLGKVADPYTCYAMTVNGDHHVYMAETQESGNTRNQLVYYSLNSDGDNTEKTSVLSGSASIEALAISPDHAQLAITFSDGKVVIVSLSDMNQQKSISAHQGQSILGCDFSTDGSILITASHDNTVKTWDVEAGTLRQTLDEHSNPVWDCASFGAWLVSASADHSLKMWNLSTTDNEANWERKQTTWWGISTDRKSMLVEEGGTLNLVSVINDEQRVTFGEVSAISSAAIAPNRETVAVATYRSQAIIVREAAGSIKNLLGHTKPTNALCFSPNGQYLASASQDSTVRLWDIEAGVEHVVLRGHGFQDQFEFLDSVNHCVFTSDGKRLISASDDMTIKVWDLENASEIQTLTAHDGAVNQVQLFNNDRYLLSASSDRTMRLWDVESGKPTRNFEGHRGPVTACAVHPDGYLIASTSKDNTLKVWDMEKGTCISTFYAQRALLRCDWLEGHKIVAYGVGKNTYYLQLLI